MLFKEKMARKMPKNTINRIEKIIENTNQETADLLYISSKIHMPAKSEIKKCYREDFVLVPKNKIKKICADNKKIHLPQEYKNHDFFVYNQRKNQIVPFKENDYLMDKDGYLTFDGKSYIQYDNDGNEL